jgi:hypothetical protein
MVGNALQDYAGYWSLFGDNGKKQMSLFWSENSDVSGGRTLKLNSGSGAYPYNQWITSGFEYNATGHRFSVFAYNSFGLEPSNIYGSVADNESTTFNSYVAFGGYVYRASVPFGKYYGLVAVRALPPNGVMPGATFGNVI